MKPAFLPGNRLGLLNSGHEYFPALVAEIDGARSEIFLETYIFADDPTGRTVAAALGRAARRGVAVRVLVDGFGGGDFAETLLPLDLRIRYLRVAGSFFLLVVIMGIPYHVRVLSTMN